MVATRLDENVLVIPNTDFVRPDCDVVEFSLALPQEQIATLELAAHQQGMTVGQLLRELIRNFTQVRQQPTYYYLG